MNNLSFNCIILLLHQCIKHTHTKNSKFFSFKNRILHSAKSSSYTNTQRVEIYHPLIFTKKQFSPVGNLSVAQTSTTYWKKIRLHLVHVFPSISSENVAVATCKNCPQHTDDKNLHYRHGGHHQQSPKSHLLWLLIWWLFSLTVTLPLLMSTSNMGWISWF